KRSQEKGTGRASEKGYARLFLNLGKTDGIKPQNIIGLLNDNISGRKIDIGRIDLMQNFSFFEVKEQDKNKVIQNLNGVNFSGRKVSVEVAQGSSSEPTRKKDKGNKPHSGRKDRTERKDRKKSFSRR
ncbi:MAG: DbpA RNA binding domain-containing protein, partial [Dysgonamonadaceae bacterium]|nr:DbpA RNA binding domain-containing protein [Dysgonamonadaceae bacterium]